jgi:hypothetical protein
MKFTLRTTSLVFSLATLLLGTAAARSAPSDYTDLSALPATCVEETAPSFPSDNLASGDSYALHEQIKTMMERTNGNFDNENAEHFLDDWGLFLSASDAKAKVEDIYAAANAQNMPPQVLTGALMQESSMGNLGISRDFNNWSCGIGQLNVNEWCDWANQADPATQAQIGWPTAEIAAVVAANHVKGKDDLDVCSGNFLRAQHVKPFYDAGMKKMCDGHMNRPESMLVRDEMNAAIPSFEDAAADMDFTTKMPVSKLNCKHRNRYNDECLTIKPTKNEAAAANLRYLIAKSFSTSCTDHTFGIPAKAYNLRLIHDELKPYITQAQQYPEGSTYARKCMQTPTSRAYPLSVSWLLADAVYNAGEEIIPGVEKYWTDHHMTPEQVSPRDLVNAIDYTLNERKYKKHLELIGICEARFHIRNVVRNMTLPGSDLMGTDPAQSAECKNLEDNNNQYICDQFIKTTSN